MTLLGFRSVSLRSIKNILIGGILLFAIGIIVTYSRLVEFESDASTTRSTKFDGDIVPQPIPGRGQGSGRGRVQCKVDVSRFVSYWNDPRSDVDRAFRSPFLVGSTSVLKSIPERRRYLTFEPDKGGWNNIRMEFEIMIVLAAATGRTLVMPPDNPMYLLHKDKTNPHRGLKKFFAVFDDVVDTISMGDFFDEEILEKKSYPLPTDEANRTILTKSAQNCLWIRSSDNSCLILHDYLAQVADFVPDWHGEHHCLIMDDENWHKDGSGSGDETETQQQQTNKFCATRTPVYYNKEMHDAPLVHIRSHSKENRLLLHFYTFIHFTKPEIGNYYKRLIRDRVRYSDEINCAAGKIVKALTEESFESNSNNAGNDAGYFSMHIRRGDFQWPKMRLSAEEWHENTRSWLEPDARRLLYIATDETNRTFFGPLMEHYNVRFLDDYSSLAGLADVDPNFVGMIDQVVASRGRVFVGTYFSSFSAYIGRMRGYHGLSGKRMFYSHPKYWNETHSWVYPHSAYPSREYPTGWVGIDGDDEPSEKDFF